MAEAAKGDERIYKVGFGDLLELETLVSDLWRAETLVEVLNDIAGQDEEHFCASLAHNHGAILALGQAIGPMLHGSHGFLRAWLGLWWEGYGEPLDRWAMRAAAGHTGRQSERSEEPVARPDTAEGAAPRPSAPPRRGAGKLDKIDLSEIDQRPGAVEPWLTPTDAYELGGLIEQIAALLDLAADAATGIQAAVGEHRKTVDAGPVRNGARQLYALHIALADLMRTARAGLDQLAGALSHHRCGEPAANRETADAN